MVCSSAAYGTGRLWFEYVMPPRFRHVVVSLTSASVLRVPQYSVRYCVPVSAVVCWYLGEMLSTGQTHDVLRMEMLGV